MERTERHPAEQVSTKIQAQRRIRLIQIRDQHFHPLATLLPSPLNLGDPENTAQPKKRKLSYQEDDLNSFPSLFIMAAISRQLRLHP